LRKTKRRKHSCPSGGNEKKGRGGKDHDVCARAGSERLWEDRRGRQAEALRSQFCMHPEDTDKIPVKVMTYIWA
jgi:hypothetical protein